MKKAANKISPAFKASSAVPSAERKVIGMLGGLAWPSSAYAYNTISAAANKRLGGDHTVPISIWSVELGALMPHVQSENWEEVSKTLANGARRLEKSGADFVYMTCNTLHICSKDIEKSIRIPFIHAVDSVGKAVEAAGQARIALLGTKFTMEKDFYKQKLQQDYKLDVIIPELADRNLMHKIIFDELVRNDIREESKNEFLRIMREMKDQGAQGAILACTEIGLIIKQEDMPGFPLYDSDMIHSLRALDISLGAEPEIFSRRKAPAVNNNRAHGRKQVHANRK